MSSLLTGLMMMAVLIMAGLIVTVLIVAVTPADPAAAQVDDPNGQQSDDESVALVDPAVASLEVIGQTNFVAADGTFGLDLAIQPAEELQRAPDRYELSITVFGRLETEAQVDEPLTQPLNRLPPLPFDELPGSDPGVVHLDIPIRSGDRFDDLDRVLLPNPGVYPVSIELRTDEGPIATARTHLIRLAQDAADPSEPLPVAVVLNVSTAEGLTVDDVQQLLIDHPSIPLTVALEPGVANLLANDPQRTASFVAALAGRPALVAPTVDLDPSALAEIGQQELYLEATAAASETLADLGLTPAEQVAILDAPLTEAGARVLTGQGVRAVLDTEGRAAGVWRLGSGATRLRVIRFDRDLSLTLGGGDDGPHRANRVLARLTLRSQFDDAAVVLGGSRLGVDPRSSIDAFLRSLTQPGAPRPILLPQAMGGPAERFAERPDQDLEPIAEQLSDIQTRLATYEDFHHRGGNSPDHYRRQILAGLTRQRNPEDRQRALAGVDAQFDADLAVVQLYDGQPVTLAARSAPIPITVENEAVGPRRIMLRFASDKVVAAEDQQIISIDPGTSSINVELETRALGISPMEVSVWTPDGSTRLAVTRFEIRSTAIPGFGLLATSGAVILLAAWWALDARKRREAMLPSESNAPPGSGSV